MKGIEIRPLEIRDLEPSRNCVTSDIPSIVPGRNLAIFGGEPAFSEKVYVGRLNIGNREAFLARVNDMLDRRWLTNDGPFVKELEARIANLVGVQHCIAMCNATVALEITIRALGLSGEVIVPSYTFVATAHALQWQEITPVFADIREETHSLDPDAVERMITPRTTGIMGVHLWGQACDVDALTEIARRRKLRLLFDAAHAFGCTHKGRMIGNNGDAEVLSFHATKFFNSMEGGAVLTNDDALARRDYDAMRNFGFTGMDTVGYLGINGKMSEVSAAMGLANLDNLEDVVEVNRRNWQAYQAGLAGLRGINLYQFRPSERCNHQYVVVEMNANATGLTQDELISVLWAENVIARKYFWPGCHRMEPYKSLYPHAGLLLPVTERVSQRVILLPTGTTVDMETVSRICDIIRTALDQASAIRGELKRGQRARPA